MKTLHIHIKGQVQGVGFRPFVWSLANELRLKGSVANTSDGVHIYVNADENSQREFLDLLLSRAPGRSIVSSLTVKEVADRHFIDFSIEESQVGNQVDIHISSDFGICSECAHDILDHRNKRFQYPFTTCTQCGPRFSILKGVPYDRYNTAMADFEMCVDCEIEYANPKDRRYYSQTNSCKVCGINLYEIHPTFSKVTVDHIVKKLKDGEIIAIKGAAGYLLMCRALDTAIVTKLRERKKRPNKPFALLAYSLELLEDFVIIKPQEREALQGSDRPIVLCQSLPKGKELYGIAPGLDSLGIMLPFDGLSLMISKAIGEPLIATSGNIHQSPIISDDEEALLGLKEIADTIISNDREIVFSQDDSVLRFSPRYNLPILLRRSKGLSPSFWGSDVPMLDGAIALGADLKATFAISTNEKIYVSPFLGNLESWDSQQRFRHTLKSLVDLLQVKETMVLTDLHPTYFSSQIQLESMEQAPRMAIQHHQAHLGACLLENGLVHSNKTILGLIWDGLGWGEDGHLWGGECIKYHQGQFTRIGHLQQFRYFLGDKMSLEPRLSAFSMLHSCPELLGCIQDCFSGQEWDFYCRAFEKSHSLLCSSMGRLFDSVAAILGLCTISSFEGEAAMKLEAAAQRYADVNGFTSQNHPAFEVNDQGEIIWVEVLRSIVHAKLSGESVEKIAMDFHYSLVDLVRKSASRAGIVDLAFSGGVFQNGLLIDLLIHYLSPLGYILYFHKQLSPNDENIAVGQLTIHHINTHFINHQKQEYVLSNTR